MAVSKDITGQKFGRLTVVSQFIYVPDTLRTYAKCNCICECGNTSTAIKALLLNGATQSCGCLRIEATIKRWTIDGRCKHGVEYRAWRAAISRCTDPTNKSYPRYGGRGITVHESWAASFFQFLTDMGPRPARTTLDRINNDLGYTPDNCRWANMTVQQNNRSNNHMLVMRGQEKTVAQWARELKMTRFKVIKLSRLDPDIKDPRS